MYIVPNIHNSIFGTGCDLSLTFWATHLKTTWDFYWFTSSALMSPDQVQNPSGCQWILHIGTKDAVLDVPGHIIYAPHSYMCHASPDGSAVWGVVVSTRWWLLVDHCVLRNWDRILVRAVKGLISRAGMVSICQLLWQRDVKLQQTNHTCVIVTIPWYRN